MATREFNASIGRFPERWRRRLYLPTYQVTHAAYYIDESTQLVTSWQYGGGKLGPVLGTKQRGKPLNYLELVEMSFVATLRRLGVSLQRIRKARQYAASNFNVEFPFAELAWRDAGAELLLNYSNIDPGDGEAIEERAIIADRNGQMVWHELVNSRFLQFDYEDYDFVVGWYPRGREASVRIDPRIAFGAPTVGGFPTWVAKGRWQAQESLDEIADDFDVAVETVKAALAFEGITAEAA